MARFLPTYLAQECSEIIIVDDFSARPVMEELRRAGVLTSGAIPIRVIRNDSRLQQPRSREIGVKAATQDLIFFGEDDAYLAPGHIRSLVDWLFRLDAAACASPWLLTRCQRAAVETLEVAKTLSELINTRYMTIASQKRVTAPLAVPWLHTLALIRKQVILQVGFDSNFTGNAFREETDFYLSAHAAGYSLYYVPGPPAFHYKGPLNTSGGQHESGILKELTHYEFSVMKNNYYFLSKQKRNLYAIGRPVNPLIDTASFMARRLLGYPGRLRAELSNRRRNALRGA